MIRECTETQKELTTAKTIHHRRDARNNHEPLIRAEQLAADDAELTHAPLSLFVPEEGAWSNTPMRPVEEKEARESQRRRQVMTGRQDGPRKRMLANERGLCVPWATKPKY